MFPEANLFPLWALVPSRQNTGHVSLVTLNGDLGNMAPRSLNPVSGVLPTPLPPTLELAATDTTSRPGVIAGRVSKPGLDNEVVGDAGRRGGTKGRLI